MGYIEDGEHFLQLNDFMGARRCFGYARRQNSNDWRAWFGLARVFTKNFTQYTGENWVLFVNTAKSLTTPENIAWMDALMRDYPEKFIIWKKMRNS